MAQLIASSSTISMVPRSGSACGPKGRVSSADMMFFLPVRPGIGQWAACFRQRAGIMFIIHDLPAEGNRGRLPEGPRRPAGQKSPGRGHTPAAGTQEGDGKRCERLPCPEGRRGGLRGGGSVGVLQGVVALLAGADLDPV